MSAPDWKDVLPSPPEGTRLVEAWFTTYDRPDAGLLVEHLLPSLIGASHVLNQDQEERTLFFGELGTALEALRGRLTVISSPHAQAREADQYPWLWRYVSHFTVGARSAAVQHAKLWVFHWKGNNKELMEIHISSTNLTSSAFKEQIQAGWSSCVELEKKTTKARQRGWADLVDFLGVLGDSAGERAQQRIERLVQLLGRAKPPAGVTFIASAPGSGGRAARRLKPLRSSAVHILTPTIGSWSADTLKAWCKDLGVTPDNVSLKWIDADHPWERSSGWTLTENAATTLKTLGVKINSLPFDAQFCVEHVDGDKRWSHAKLYLFCNDRKNHLLVTSANWSRSAWGAGTKDPNNFELGVIFETDWSQLKTFDTELSTPYCSERSRIENTALQWAEASWDGQEICMHVRSTDLATPITATVIFSDDRATKIQLGSSKEATKKWGNAESTPLNARFEQGREGLEVDVIDQRLRDNFAQTPLPEVNPRQVQALRDAFLLERYGGPAVDTVEAPGPDSSKKGKSGMGTRDLPADYSLPAWLESRAGFEIVDNWQTALREATDADREQVLWDGKQLELIYKRRANAAGCLVAEELGWLLEEQ